MFTKLTTTVKTKHSNGNLMKDEVRKIAEENHLINAKRKDSQGICFLGKINYNDYIEQYLGQEDGKIIELDTGATLGTHHGHWFHTIGQRKGLNLSGGPYSRPHDSAWCQGSRAQARGATLSWRSGRQ